MEKAVLDLKSMKTEPIKEEKPVSEVSSETTLKSMEKTDNTSSVNTSITTRYAIIIASYKSEEVAQSLARERGNTVQVIPVPEIGRFGVAYDVYDTYKDAKNNQKELVLDFGNCRIVDLKYAKIK
tara:strand:- start:71 stop:445 length:375 start_codon:yes stop_codon:yes gene_type:complete